MPRKSRSSAVGSAPRSGRGGRAFESPLLDRLEFQRWNSNCYFKEYQRNQQNFHYFRHLIPPFYSTVNPLCQRLLILCNRQRCWLFLCRFYFVLMFPRFIACRGHDNVDWLAHIYSFYFKLYSELFLEQ